MSYAAADDAPLDAATFAALMAPLGPFERAPEIAVAVSGGADSLALALLAADWAKAQGARAVALTVDHRLRAGSGDEARQVGRWLRGRGMLHRTLVWDGPHPAADIQAAARAARYRLLAEWCTRRGILHLLLGHHRDDQAETLLLRLARGSGLDGLAGMPAVGELGGEGGPRLLRPLLSVPKSALEATLRARGQDWIEDPSNASDAFARVRMRRLMPGLAGEGMTAARLAATAGRLGRARAALDDATAALAARCAGLFPAGYAWLDLHPYRAAPVETALRCLAHLLRTVGGGAYTPRLERLERLHQGLAAGEPGGRTLAGCRIDPRGDHALICREAAGPGDPIEVSAGQTVVWDDRFRIAFAGSGTAWLGSLGATGWREAVAARPELRRSTVPPAARVGLPALRDRAGLLEVPHLGYRRADSRGPRVATVEFAPPQALAPARFMVV